MPAYRSAAEGEVRDAVVSHLRMIRPQARIIHEINCSNFGPNRIDVLAVSSAEIIAVEVKSSKDKLDRLPAQIASMKLCANRVYAALHEKFLVPLGRPEHGMGIAAPEEAGGAIPWIFPRMDRKGQIWCGSEWIEKDRREKPKLCIPVGSINMLWREELHQICATVGVKKLNMPEAIDAIRWHMTGDQITRAVCATLRARACPEADPPILTTETTK